MEKILECFHQKLNFFSTEERKTWASWMTSFKGDLIVMIYGEKKDDIWVSTPQQQYSLYFMNNTNLKK